MHRFPKMLMSGVGEQGLGSSIYQEIDQTIDFIIQQNLLLQVDQVILKTGGTGIIETTVHLVLTLVMAPCRPPSHLGTAVMTLEGQAMAGLGLKERDEAL